MRGGYGGLAHGDCGPFPSSHESNAPVAGIALRAFYNAMSHYEVRKYTALFRLLRRSPFCPSVIAWS